MSIFSALREKIHKNFLWLCCWLPWSLACWLPAPPASAWRLAAAGRITPRRPSRPPSRLFLFLPPLQGGPGRGVPPASLARPTSIPTQTPSPTPRRPNPTATPDTRLDPARWDQWPVIPTVSAAARDLQARPGPGQRSPRLLHHRRLPVRAGRLFRYIRHQPLLAGQGLHLPAGHH